MKMRAAKRRYYWAPILSAWAQGRTPSRLMSRWLHLCREVGWTLDI